MGKTHTMYGKNESTVLQICTLALSWALISLAMTERMLKLQNSWKYVGKCIWFVAKL